MLLKLGELARRTGLTVRTLHHYDAIGLLRPSGRSAAGYRLYDRKDIARLHRIQALRRLDIALAEIGALLEGEGAGLEHVIDQQITALDQEIRRAIDLRERLRGLRARLQADEEPELDDWLSTLAMMNFYDRYFTPAERERMRRHGSFDDRDFDALKLRMRTLMDSGVPPDSPEVLPLAERWIALTLHHLAGDARLLHKIDVLHRSEPDVPLFTGIDAALLDYATRATAEYRLSLYARHMSETELAPVRERFLRHYRQWPVLFAEARELHERGTDPRDAPARDLAARWMRLFLAVWGEDPNLHRKVLQANQSEPGLTDGFGMEDGALQFVRASLDHLKQSKKDRP